MGSQAGNGASQWDKSLLGQIYIVLSKGSLVSRLRTDHTNNSKTGFDFHWFNAWPFASHLGHISFWNWRPQMKPQRCFWTWAVKATATPSAFLSSATSNTCHRCARGPLPTSPQLWGCSGQPGGQAGEKRKVQRGREYSFCFALMRISFWLANRFIRGIPWVFLRFSMKLT